MPHVNVSGVYDELNCVVKHIGLVADAMLYTDLQRIVLLSDDARALLIHRVAIELHDAESEDASK